MTIIFQRSENGLSWHPDTTGDSVRSLNLLFVGATIANFEYWSEFILRIQRDELHRDDVREIWGSSRIPPMFCLRLRNTWWVGDRTLWDDSVERFEIKASLNIPEEAALQASTVVRLLGSTLTDLRISEMGDLDIGLSNGEQLHVAGAGGKWDEGWIFELPADDPDREKWSVVCDSDGIVYAKWPRAPDT